MQLGVSGHHGHDAPEIVGVNRFFELLDRVEGIHAGLRDASLSHFSRWCSGRPSGRPSDGLKPVAYTKPVT
jgi:hypothetical protein